jgi:hypothetical protein
LQTNVGLTKKIFHTLIGFAIASQNASAASSSSKLAEHFKSGQFAAAIADFENLTSEEKKQPAHCYLAALAHMSRHDYSAAETLLIHCQQLKFEAYSGWASIDSLLKRIHTLKRLSPPFYGDFKDGSASITVFGVKNEWLNPIYKVLPVFVKRGREGFGDKQTHINLYLFDNKDKYVEFFETMSEGHKPGGDQAGTGVINLVVFSQYCLDGSSRGVNDLPDRLGCVLHEYGHALCSTAYGDDFFGVVPGWLNEGLADLVARPLFGRQFDEQPAVVAREMAANHTPLPSYDDLCHHFYGHGSAPYILAKLMVARIFGDQSLSRVSNVLDSAKAKHGNFEAAIIEVMKVEPRKVYDEVVRKYWHR